MLRRHTHIHRNKSQVVTTSLPVGVSGVGAAELHTSYIVVKNMALIMRSFIQQLRNISQDTTEPHNTSRLHYAVGDILFPPIRTYMT